jgi:hypothetical protein|tara:strand:+ start:129 stop:1022 length:894 start_codon:yes stop_codon:yes gene_type:complete
MFKKIFKAAKNLIRSPVGQLGIGLLLPGLGPTFGAMSKLGGIKGALGGIGAFAAANPMLTQAGLGLISGAKPEDVLRNVAYGTAMGGIRNLDQPGGFMGGVKGSLGMNPATALNNPVQGQVYDPLAGSSGAIRETVAQQPAKPGLLKSITDSLINENETDFFKKYSPLLKIGAVGASVLSAVLSDEEQRLLYDPTKNPYLPSGGRDKAFFEDINPLYAATMNQGGVMDFPEKEGMINGPGDGQSDDIPAMLSDGEFVMTKQAVMAAGNGDRDEGTKQMYSMMNNLEEKAQSMGIGRV